MLSYQIIANLQMIEYLIFKKRLKGSGGDPQGLHFVPVVADQAPLALSNPGAFGTFLVEKYIEKN